MKLGVATLADLARFDEIIDVRSPAEYRDDHIPGAINCPVLDDDERSRVGTVYTRESPFAARKVGAALVARNIARHLETGFAERPKHWRPLVYCWRGGQRSHAMVTILRAVGWNAAQLEGGYKTYRHHVLERLEVLPREFDFRVLCGPTGSAKTRLLQTLASAGQQVLDLETLAAHKGSVLGVLPETPQPGQKALESAILATLSGFDRHRPVYVEAESRKIGQLRLPDALLERMRASRCLAIEVPLEARVDFLLGDYGYFLADPDWLKTRLSALCDQHRRETLERWLTLVDHGSWRTLVTELLEQHYDPHYRRSQNKHYCADSAPVTLTATGLSDSELRRLASAITAAEGIGNDICA